MMLTLGLLSKMPNSVFAQILPIPIPAAFWKTLISPDAPAANLAEAAFQKGRALGQGMPLVRSSTTFPSAVIPIVWPPLAIAQSVAACFARRPPLQNTLVGAGPMASRTGAGGSASRVGGGGSASRVGAGGKA